MIQWCKGLMFKWRANILYETLNYLLFVCIIIIFKTVTVKASKIQKQKVFQFLLDTVTIALRVHKSVLKCATSLKIRIMSNQSRGGFSPLETSSFDIQVVPRLIVGSSTFWPRSSMFQLLVSTNLFPHSGALFFSKYCHIIGIKLSTIAQRLTVKACPYFLWKCWAQRENTDRKRLQQLLTGLSVS